MRHFLPLLVLLCLSLYLPAQSINAIVGDTSWFEKHGAWPSEEADEQARISTHLDYVYQRLLQETPKNLSAAQVEKRQHLLGMLANYIQSASFPRYYQHPYKRRPVFIDDRGTLCAVGHLIAEDAGRAEAERINALFRLEFLLDMEDEGLVAWQEQSGFSLKELAMIQPTYGWERQPIDPYFIFQDPETGLFGLKKNKGTQKIIIPADYQSLSYSAQLPFVVGVKEDQKWDLFLPDGKILGRSYLRIDFLKRGAEVRALATNKRKVEAFDTTGDEVWEYYNAEPHQVIGSQVILQELDRKDFIICNWEGRVLSARNDSVVPLNNMFRQHFAWKVKFMQKFNGSQDPERCLMAIRPAWAVLDTAGTALHPEPLADLQFEGDVFRFLTFDGQSTLHNVKGEAFPIEGAVDLERGLGFNAAIITIEKDGQRRRGVLNGQGAWLVEPKYQELFIHTGHRYLIRSPKGMGYVDASGNLTIPAEYDTIVPMHSLYFVTKNKRMGLYSWTGTKLLGLDYDTIGWLAQDGSNYSTNIIFSQRGDLFEIRDQNGMVVPGYEGYEGFTRLYMGAILLHKGEERIFAQYLQGQLHLKPEIKLDYARFLNGWSFAYGLNGKEGLWTIVHHGLAEASHFRAAVFDSILPSHPQDNNHLLVRQNGLWGIYAIRGDSLLVPCESEYLYPQNRQAHSGWIYFRKQGVWYGYFYTVPNLVLQMPAAQGRLEEMWGEELRSP